MRKKLREIMDKEEGFTLVELLAVIVILGIILAIAIPSVGRVIDRAQESANDAEYGLIVDAGRIYLTAEDIDETDNKNSVAVSKLISEGYIEERDAKGLDSSVQDYHVHKIKEEKNIYMFYQKVQLPHQIKMQPMWFIRNKRN